MIDKQFEQIFEAAVKRERGTLIAKSKEYARVDRLSNFKKAALTLECSPERALEGMLQKHLTTIHDFVCDIEKSDTCMELSQWQEKIGDARNYLILLEALIIERTGGK